MLKVSGEHLAGKDGVGADGAALKVLAEEIRILVKKKIQVAVVVGGGNFWRFRDNSGLSLARSVSDSVGMLATMMNARLLTEALNQTGVKAFALATHADGYYAYNYSPELGKKILNDGGVVICAGGTGNPYFTTDSAAALRALELSCDVLLKATNVDGIYDKDPNKFKDAVKYDEVTFKQALDKHLDIMDQAAFSLCQDQALPIIVFNFLKKGSLEQAAKGDKIGTHVHA